MNNAPYKAKHWFGQCTMSQALLHALYRQASTPVTEHGYVPVENNAQLFGKTYLDPRDCVKPKIIGERLFYNLW